MPLKSLGLKQDAGLSAVTAFGCHGGVVRLLSSVFALAESGRCIIACVYDVPLSFCPVLKHGPRSLRSVQGMRRHRSCRSESNCLSQNSGV